MASTAYCLYCFEVLAASLEKRQPLDLKQVEELWEQYNDSPLGTGIVEDEKDVEMTDDEDVGGDGEEEAGEEVGEEDEEPIGRTLRPREMSRLQAPSPASASSSSSPSTSSANSSRTGLSENSKSSSRSSPFSFIRRSATQREEHPLFVTWNTVNSRGHKSLRGCIGTFQAQELSSGLRSYALTSAFDDLRFSPISLSELPSLSNHVTLLMAFTPCKGPLDWTLGTHGIRISFSHQGKRYGSTYLPDVAVEQGWTKEETLVSLMRKAGWSGRSSEWRKVSDMKCVRYEGKGADASYRVWREWRKWVNDGVKGR
ncbi:MAG: hypothetical protein LQ340_004121 [Diploschistes diacapsis]|nr:MAG: hypothetical protein LQ340_004121 [Diploschistes diacapsis]